MSPLEISCTFYKFKNLYQNIQLNNKRHFIWFRQVQIGAMESKTKSFKSITTASCFWLVFSLTTRLMNIDHTSKNDSNSNKTKTAKQPGNFGIIDITGN